MIQGSDEWFAARLGRVTASRIGDVLAKTKSGWGASRYSYMGELIAERLTGRPNESFTTTAMQWGKDNEAKARAAYEFKYDKVVTEVGFIEHPRFEGLAGASPDGLVENGLIEIKCPSTITHLETITSGNIPTRYQLQMQWQMECTGKSWCDFISFDPRLPENLQLFVKRVEIGELIEPEIRRFTDEMRMKLLVLESYRG
jgi:putative phage-type endonuclease